MDRSELNELAGLARQGGRRDKEAFLGKVRPLVCRWALVWTGSPDASEDVAQEVLIRVNRSLVDFSPAASVSTWIYRITRNVAVDQARRNGRDCSARDAIKLTALTEAAAPPADRGLELKAAADLLRTMMERLSPQQRAAFDLVDVQGFGAGDAAEMLEVAPATLRVHLFRARQSLRAHGPGAIGGEQ